MVHNDIMIVVTVVVKIAIAIIIAKVISHGNSVSSGSDAQVFQAER